MKITIEFPDKYIEVAKGLLLAECKKKEDELHLEEVASTLKNTTEPILVNQDIVGIVCGEETGHMNMLLALIAFAKVSKNY